MDAICNSTPIIFVIVAACEPEIFNTCDCVREGGVDAGTAGACQSARLLLGMKMKRIKK